MLLLYAHETNGELFMLRFEASEQKRCSFYFAISCADVAEFDLFSLALFLSLSLPLSFSFALSPSFSFSFTLAHSSSFIVPK